MPELMESAIAPSGAAIKLEDTEKHQSYPEDAGNAAQVDTRQILEENPAPVEAAPGPSEDTNIDGPIASSPGTALEPLEFTTTEGEPFKIESQAHTADLAALPIDAPLVLHARPAEAPDGQGIANIPELSPLITRRDVARRDLPMYCHVVGCNIGLAAQAEYYQRYRICKDHLRASALLVDGIPQRFCQQCGRFHNLDAFDADKRNCRARLAQHNSRRRKAGAAPGVMPYGQGQGARRRTYLEYDRYDEDYEVDLEDFRQRQRARTASNNDFSIGPGRGSSGDGPDVGLLDQLVAAAVGMEDEDAMDYDEGIIPQNGAHPDQTAGPPRVMSRPADHDVAGDGNVGGNREASNMGQGNPSAYPNFADVMPSFGGWRPGSEPFRAPPPAHVPPPQLAAGMPAGMPGIGVPGGSQSAISEREQLLGRQLLQQLLTSAGMQVSLPPPPPPAEPGTQLLDMLKALAGGLAGANRPPMPTPPQPQQYMQQAQQLYRNPRPPPPPPPAPVAASRNFVGDGVGGVDPRLGAAAGSLEVLKQLVSYYYYLVVLFSIALCFLWL